MLCNDTLICWAQRQVIDKWWALDCRDKAEYLLTFLLDKSAIPYFSILKKWIFSGVLEDPFDEFFIRENRKCKKENIELDLNDRYWDERFTIRD